QLAAAGQLQATDMVLEVGAAKWVTAASIPGLLAAATSPPPELEAATVPAPELSPVAAPQGQPPPTPAATPVSAPQVDQADQDMISASHIRVTFRQSVERRLPTGAFPMPTLILQPEEPLPAIPGYDILGVLGRGGM